MTIKSISKPYFLFNGIKINNFTWQESIHQIDQILAERRHVMIFTPNAYHFVLLQKDSVFRSAYEKAEIILPDGMSLIFVSKLFGCPLKERIAGADLFLEICRLASLRNKRLFLLGGEEGSEIIALKKLKSLWPQLEVAAYAPPWGFDQNEKESEALINLIHEFKTDILCCFVGTPKSEKWLFRYFDQLQVNLAISLGATLNYFVGRKKRAPLLIRRLGLEWAWRWIHEPWRLSKRYLIGNWQFLLLVIKELINYR